MTMPTLTEQLILSIICMGDILFTAKQLSYIMVLRTYQITCYPVSYLADLTAVS